MRLNIGCGPNVFPHDGWLNYDRVDVAPYLKCMLESFPVAGIPEHQERLIQYLKAGGVVDFKVHDLKGGFAQHESGSIDGIYLGQMIEHINNVYEAPPFLSECRRMLKPGGVLRITTPDLGVLIEAYLNGTIGKYASEQPAFFQSAHPSAQLAHIMYGAAGPACSWSNYEGHMFLYTRDSMRQLLLAAGFTAEPVFYNEVGKSLDEVMAREVVDAGISHSFITEVTT